MKKVFIWQLICNGFVGRFFVFSVFSLVTKHFFVIFLFFQVYYAIADQKLHGTLDLNQTSTTDVVKEVSLIQDICRL